MGKRVLECSERHRKSMNESIRLVSGSTGKHASAPAAASIQIEGITCGSLGPHFGPRIGRVADAVGRFQSNKPSIWNPRDHFLDLLRGALATTTLHRSRVYTRRLSISRLGLGLGIHSKSRWIDRPNPGISHTYPTCVAPTRPNRADPRTAGPPERSYRLISSATGRPRKRIERAIRCGRVW